MSDINKCPTCRGTKNVMGAGFIYHKCDTCKGVGYVEKEATQQSPSDKTPKPRGRRKST